MFLSLTKAIIFLRYSLFFIILIFHQRVNAQIKLSLNDALNFAFYQNGNSKTQTFALITNNQLEKNKFTLANSLNYTLLYNPIISQNEFAEKFTFSYSKAKNSAFVIYQYNHSLVRRIDNNHLIGIGYGIRDSIFGFKINLSYAILNEFISFNDQTTKNNLRNSFRIKLSKENKKIGISSEYFFQPNFASLNDYTLYGTTKLTFKIRESFSFNISDVYNYFNRSTTPIIHNFTVGLAFNYNTK